MIYYLSVLLLVSLYAVVYRMRGNGYPWGTTGGRLLWCAALYAGTHSILAASGGFLGMLIPHGKWYYMKTRKQWAIITAIYCLRGTLVGIPLTFGIQFGIVCALAHALGWMFNRRHGTDPLLIAEPLIGSLYAIFLIF